MKPTAEQIRDVALSVLGIDKEAFMKARASKCSYFVRPRQIICYIARNLGYTCSIIGECICLDYATVLYHEKVAKDHIMRERDFEEDVNRVFMALGVQISTFSINGWLVRDSEEQGGSLLLIVGRRPDRDENQGVWKTHDDGEIYEIPKKAFPDTTWEHGARTCELTLRIK